MNYLFMIRFRLCIVPVKLIVEIFFITLLIHIQLMHLFADGNCLCSKSVMWEFRKQDIKVDGHLTAREMVSMESNRREPCMKPLLKSCDKNADGQLTRGEWCCCFQDTGMNLKYAITIIAHLMELSIF